MGKILDFRRPKRSKRTRLKKASSLEALLLLVLAIGALIYVVLDTARLQPDKQFGPQLSTRWSKCNHTHADTCVVDGDTLRVHGQRIRIMDLNTPEIFSPECDQEKILGEAATRYAIHWLNQGPVEIKKYGSIDKDRYGRSLRVILRDGETFASVMRREGLARRRSRDWCS